MLPILELHERVKFGKDYANISAVQGLQSTSAGILIAHSSNDDVVPTKYGYDKFYQTFKDDNRFEFVLYEDRGHTGLLYSESAVNYQEELNASYLTYIKQNKKRDNDKNKNAYLNQFANKTLYFEINEQLFDKVINKFNSCCIN